MKRIVILLILWTAALQAAAQVVSTSACVTVIPSAPSVHITSSQQVTLTANPAPSGFSYRWFGPDGTTQVWAAQTYPISETLSSSETYYLAYYHTSTACLSTKVPVRINFYAEDLNWTREYEARIPLSGDFELRNSSQTSSYKETTYHDGLGRVKQQVAVQASVNGLDIITPVVYDAYGRPYRDYLPFANNSTSPGLYRFRADTLHSTYYTAEYTDSSGFADKTYEASPLNRVIKQGVPGTPWVGKEILLTDATNTSSDAVRIWTVNSSGLPVTSATYSMGALSKLETTDENGQKVHEYKDKLGRIILKKVQISGTPGADHTGWLSTYHVYDAFGRLRVTIPPSAVEIIAAAAWASGTSTDTVLSNAQYFRYSYDERGRVIEKKVPGKGIESMLYDRQDRLVGYQDANMAASSPKQWLYTKYDGLGRVVMTGLVNDNNLRSDLQTTVDTLGGNNANVNANTANSRTGATITSAKYDGYKEYVATSTITLQAGFSMKATGNQTFHARIGSATSSATGGWPTDEGEILTVNYYDSYQLLTGFSYVVPSSPYSGFTALSSTKVHGLQTGKKVKNLETGEFYTSAIYYDDKGRVIQSLSQHQLGVTVRTSTSFNFENQPTQLLTANSSATGLETLRTFTYNPAGLLAATTHKIGSQAAKTIAQNSYNELGQITTKEFPEITDGDQTYSYNIRGWLKNLGSSLTEGYKQTNYYESGGTQNNWNGNISRVDWSGSTGSGKTRTYNYLYDPANRILTANYSAASETNWFTVEGMSYDANGNITALTRRNQRTPNTYDIVDQLSYTYQTNSNILSQVTDAYTAEEYTSKDFKERNATAYTYDANGNLKTNLDKEISNIDYNHLNLPSEVSFDTGAKIIFSYDAEGTKLTQKIYNTSGVLTKTQDYVGEMVYLDANLDYLIHEEGRVAYELETFQYEYFVKDHLGNVRQVLRNPSTQVYMATMETQNAETEEQEFTQVEASRHLSPQHNKTVGGNKVAWLNANRGRMVGPGRTQEIYAGDSIGLQVFGKYLDKKKPKVNAGSFVTQGAKDRLITNLNELALNTQRGGGGNPIALLNLASIVAGDLQKKPAPEAYLIYALYDQDSNRYEVGKKVLTRNAANQHEVLEENLYIQKDGYLETFVVNETSEDVWFDNMMVMSMSSPIAQETHFDPWGLELTGIGFQYGGIKVNKFLYNGKELIEDNSLQYLDYGARMYDPAIGRWGVVDPMSEEAPGWTPYRYGFNNPLTFTDPTGMFEYVKGGYGEDIEISQTYSHTQDGGYRSDAKRGENEHGKAVWAGMNFSVNSEGKRNSRIYRYFEYEDGTTRNISPSGGFGSRAVRGNIHAHGDGGVPTYSYNGQSGLSSSNLYVSILVDQAAKQFGITDLAALSAAISGAPILSTRGKFKNATKGTSIASKFLSKIPGKSPIPLPTITGYPTAFGGKGIRIMMTNVVGRFAGRTVPILGWGVLSYDIGRTLYNTQVEYNRITGEEQ